MTDTTEQDARTPESVISAAISQTGPWSDLPIADVMNTNATGIAVTAALNEAGYIILSKEPTEAQVSAGAIAFDEIDGDEGWLVEFTAVYRAMTSAHRDTGPRTHVNRRAIDMD